MVQWARGNAALNKLEAHPIRWIVDDVHKFMNRELRRGRKYDGIILDPPTYGRGGNGETYKIERDLTETLRLCRALLSDDPLFLLLSAHTPGHTPIVLENILTQALRGLGGSFSAGEMCLSGAADVFKLPSGAYVRWTHE
jgi:23S rRNA (cytosine1962-C5)-methyltransferase